MDPSTLPPPVTGSPTRAPDAAGRDLRRLSAAFAGDERAVGSLYDEHVDSLYRLACRTLSSSRQAQDVVVDVMVQACTAPGLLVADGRQEGGLRLALARRTYERCLELRRPGARPPAGAVVAVWLFAGCARREVALILGVVPADVPLLLTRDVQRLAGPTPRSSTIDRP